MTLIYLIRLFIAGFFIIGSFSFAFSQTENTSETAIAFGGRILGDDTSTRLMIEFDKKVRINPFFMDNPPRLVIDMGKTAFRFQDSELVKPRGIIRELRFGTMARGQSRMVISLNAPAKIATPSFEKLSDGKFRLTVDMENVGLEEFRQQIRLQRETIGTSGNLAIKTDRLRPAGKNSDRKLVVLDPGHGGIDGGAHGANGTIEKEITLIVAKRIEKAILETGKYDVMLTRRGDEFISLKERVQLAIRSQADLFVSIHADTLSQKDVRGATVYTLSRKASDELSRQLAESANRADLVAGLAIENVNDRVVDILADLAARETKKFSVRFAKRVVNVFRDEIKLIKNPHRYAAFGVLKDPNVPSVLLELGYLSNEEDEALLRSGKWRSKLARSLVQAIDLFFAGIDSYK